MTAPGPAQTAAGGWFAADGANGFDGILRRAQQERFTGWLHAIDPAGIGIRLADGLITAVVTPTAPGSDSLLLKSGRVSQSDWSRAVDAAAGSGGGLDEALLSRSLVGRGELDVIRTAALFDGVFAVFLDAPGGWETGPDGSGVEPVLPLMPGVTPETALAEADRRLALLTRRWGPPAQLARSRPLATAKAAQQASGITPRHRELVLCANGRRTPRDIAFVLGRGLYAVMTDIAQAERRGLLQTRDQAAPAALPSAAVRRVEPAPDPAAATAASPGSAAPGAASPDSAPRPLPQRSARPARPAGRGEGMTPYPGFDRTHTDRPAGG